MIFFFFKINYNFFRQQQGLFVLFYLKNIDCIPKIEKFFVQFFILFFCCCSNNYWNLEKSCHYHPHHQQRKKSNSIFILQKIDSMDNDWIDDDEDDKTIFDTFPIFSWCLRFFFNPLKKIYFFQYPGYTFFVLFCYSFYLFVCLNIFFSIYHYYYHKHGIFIHSFHFIHWVAMSM